MFLFNMIQYINQKDIPLKWGPLNVIVISMKFPVGSLFYSTIILVLDERLSQQNSSRRVEILHALILSTSCQVHYQLYYHFMEMK